MGDEGANHTCEITHWSSFMGVYYLCANLTRWGNNAPLSWFTTQTDSLVGKTLVMIANDVGSIPAQSTISMTFLHGSSNSL